jgi:membrane-anchored mycosin MYCP
LIHGPVRLVVRTAAVLSTVSALVAVAPLQVAAAVEPPSSDAAASPPDGPPGPETSMRKDRGNCTVGGVLPNSDLAQPPPPAVALHLEQAHKFSTGAGVTVAVIDTGVRAQPRLPGMIPGGDYIDAGDGFEDCDAHGTIVAGIIGAAPAPTDGLIGVAPAAQILAIRAASPSYTPENMASNPDDPNSSRTALEIRTLARAVRHAADMGAKVITVSVPACVKVTTPVDQAMLGGALKYARDVKDALVVAAAGNSQGIDGGAGQQNCADNPGPDPSRPTDPRNWGAVTVISTPAWFDDLVLSVGFVSPDGLRAENSMSGPWVDVAAPGTGIVSLSSTGEGVINGVPGQDGQLVPIAGTSFAAAFVAGLAALVRSRFPQMSAADVAERIIITAHAPARGVDNVVGRGLIDPVAALTYQMPNDQPAQTQSAQLELPPPPPGPDKTPKKAAALAIGLVVLAAAAVAVVMVATGTHRKGRR